MTLGTFEFIRRLLIHVLPKGLHRIRHYGLFAKGACADNIARARELLAVAKPEAQPTAADASKPTCPCCGGRMIIIEVFTRCSATASADTSSEPHPGRHLMTASQSRQSAHRVRRLSTGRGRARSDIPLSPQIVQQFTTFDAIRRTFMNRLTVAHLAGPARSQSHT
ncbi:transposase [Bradyrhizobium sp. WSM3983]|uniref:transposase n=1 Tax=Bradyrhizobium sp. WSM3983 TaxID=1038867 RepID=UPI0004027A93